MWFVPAHRNELLLRWSELGTSLGCVGQTWDLEGRRLLRSWARWPRRYHNTPHLHACLRHFSQVRNELADPHAVELALWFHDVIYWPWLPRNEEKSAAWARRFILEMGLGPEMSGAVSRHILDTRHQAVPHPGDAQWVVDIDLAILGQNETAYRQFERDVRCEYRWVALVTLREGPQCRAAVLHSPTAHLQHPLVS